MKAPGDSCRFTSASEARQLPLKLLEPGLSGMQAGLHIRLGGLEEPAVFCAPLLDGQLLDRDRLLQLLDPILDLLHGV